MPLTPAQELCATTFDHSIAVMAGAGSGKTMTLKTRVANAFFPNPRTGEAPAITSIDEVLAITFTEKAALELKSRIRQELRSRSLVEQAMRVDGAWIGTIHGMCSRILKENALGLGIDPAFELLPEETRLNMLNEAIEYTLNNNQDCRTDIAQLFGEYRRDTLVEMIRELIEHVERSPQLFDAVVLPSTIDAVNVSLDEEASAEELYEHRLIAAAQFLPALVRVAKASYTRFDTRKLERGFMDNNDLLLKAYAALQKPEISQLYANRFKLVMIDEFQDTDAMQLAIIGSFAGPHHERLCVVGDPQQSIYRFRGADLSVCEHHLHELRNTQGEAGIISLTDNFRSHKSVLDFVDMVFGPEGAKRDDGLPNFYQRLIYKRNEQELSPKKAWRESEGPRVSVQEVQHAYRRDSIGRDMSCELIAHRLRQIHDASGRPWSDMAVLLGAMTHANDYARAFDRYQIPWIISGGSVFKDKGDALLMADLAAVLGNPYDSDALYAVLASDIFGFEAQDFLALGNICGPSSYKDETGAEHFRETGFAQAFAQLLLAEKTPELQTRIVTGSKLDVALTLISQALMRVGRDSVADILETLLAKSGWLKRMQDSDGIGHDSACAVGGQSRAANALKAIRIVRDLELNGAFGPRAISEQLMAYIQGSKETPGVLSAANANFVRIMTIHASKGLQFPVVVAAELNATRQPTRLPLHLSSENGHIHALLDLQNSKAEGSKLDSCKETVRKSKAYKQELCEADAQLEQKLQDATTYTERACALERYENYHDAAELERKLYVAFTRAEEMLIVSLRDQVKSDDVQKALESYQNDIFDAQKLKRAANKRASKGQHLSPEDLQLKQESKERLDYLKAHVLLKVRPNLQAIPARIAAAAEQLSSGADSSYVLVSAPECELWAATAELPQPVNPASPRWAEGDELRFDVVTEPLACQTTHEDLKFCVPELSATEAQIRYGYGLAWSQGLLSASSLHEAASDEGPAAPHYLGSFDDEDIDELPASATEKGTAFHTVAEIAALHSSATTPFACSDERIDAVGHNHGLNSQQIDELHQEFDRWLASPVCAAMQSHVHVVPEPPFVVRLGDNAHTASGACPVALTGYIDLLAYDEFGTGTAYVVDYKTGTTIDTDEKRRAHYLTQAQTYAYALLQQGFDEVRLSFVFVDQPDANKLPQVCEFPAPGEPAWTSAQLEESLHSKIAALR